MLKLNKMCTKFKINLAYRLTKSIGFKFMTKMI